MTTLGIETNTFVIDPDATYWARRARRLSTAGLPIERFGAAEEFLARHGISDDRAEPTGSSTIDARQPFPRPGCLLLENELPGKSGLELQRHLTEQGLYLPVVFVTANATIPVAVAAIQAGAVDFLEKSHADANDLVTAAKRALECDTRFRTAFSRRAAIQSRVESLSPRLQEVLDLLIAGYELKEISRRLGTSYHTVRNQRAAILKSLQAESVVRLHELMQLVRIPTGQPTESRDVP